jgi:hypothetical protein
VNVLIAYPNVGFNPLRVPPTEFNDNVRIESKVEPLDVADSTTHRATYALHSSHHSSC